MEYQTSKTKTVTDAIREHLQPKTDRTYTQSETKRMVEAFGNEIAIRTLTTGGSYEEALALYAKQMAIEKIQLKAELKHLEARR